MESQATYYQPSCNTQQAMVKRYEDGTRVGDDVMGGANPLLLVHGNLTEGAPPPVPPPSPASPGKSKRGRPTNVIEGNHMVLTGRVDTAPFMRA